MRPRTILYVGNFFFSIFATATIYVALPFLSTLTNETIAGFAIAGGAALGAIGFFYLPRVVRRFGAQEMAVSFAILEAVTLLAVAAHPGPWATIILVVISLSLQPFLYYELDLLLEANTVAESTTGRIRTLFLTAWNIGAILAPLLIAALLDGGDDYRLIFLASAGLMAPFIVLFSARRIPAGEPPKLSGMRETMVCMAQDADLAAVTVGHLLLYLFYMWSPLYVPFYLHIALGFPWSELGWVFAIALIPYVVIEYPAGILADRFFGDKEMMLVGFVLLGGGLASIAFVTPWTPVWAILAILFVTRIGSALAESMTEGHFFRRVTERDVNAVSVFRGIWPVADAIAPALGSLILLFGSYPLLFLITGSAIALAGAVATLSITDIVIRGVPSAL